MNRYETGPLLVLGVIVVGPLVLAAAAMVLMVVLAPQGERFVPTLDSIPVPDGWEAVHTETVDGGFMSKARATRYYFADVDPVDGVAVAEGVARAGGFTIHPFWMRSCDDIAPGSEPCPPPIDDACPTHNGGLPTECFVQAVRDLETGDEYVEQLWINLGRRGSSFTIGTGDDRATVTDPDRALIRITVDAERRDYFMPASGSPSPAASQP